MYVVLCVQIRGNWSTQLLLVQKRLLTICGETAGEGYGMNVVCKVSIVDCCLIYYYYVYLFQNCGTDSGVSLFIVHS